MNRRSWLVALLLAVVTLAVPPDAPARAAPEPSELLTLRDRGTAMTWTIEADPRSRDAGQFAWRVPGHGIFLPSAPADLEVRSAQVTAVRYEGHGQVLSVPVDASTPPTASAVSLRLIGHVDLVHRSGEATLWADGERFHLVTPAGARPPSVRTLQLFEDALRANDWSAAYDLVNSDIASSFGRDEFVAIALAQQAAVGTVATLRRVAVGEVRTNPAGLTYVIVSYEVSYRRAGAITAPVRYELYWVLEGEDWRVWFGARR